MTFLNKQEDVIDIKLTSYGKKILSKGSFRPVYYAFFDDGINYQISGETQNSVESRIKQDLVARTLTEVAGVENRFKIQNKKILEGQTSLYEQMQESPDPSSIGKLLQYQLAGQNLQTQKAPKFQLRMHQNGQIDVDTSSQSLLLSGVLYNTPQLNVTSSYRILLDKKNQQELPENYIISEEDPLPDLMATEVEFLDNTKLVVSDQKILIELKEKNVN